MRSEWAPHLRTLPEAQPLAAPQVAPLRVVERVVKEDAPPRPKGWRFVPERDQNNLIVEIIATPIY